MFIFEIIERIPEDKLIEREQYWIDYLSAVLNGYNTCPIASSTLGIKQREEVKAKMRGKKLSEETRRKMSLSKTGIKRPNLMSKEARKKISIHNLGKKASEETKKKMSVSQKGRKHSAETKLKISLSRKGRKFPRQA